MTQTATTTHGASTRSRVHLACLVAFVGFGTVLRLLGSGHDPLNFDETFTAMAGRRHLASMLRYLRYNDSHPPLDYLLRAPFARAAASPFLMRLPSIVASVIALVVFACWMRRYGRLGVVATAAFAMSSFQITYGRDARMYAPIALVGVLAGWVTDGWLRRPALKTSVAVAGVALAALYLQAGGLALLLGLLVVPGFRRDRQAWQWRGALAVSLTLWGATWGPSFVTQVSRNKNHWIPFATPYRMLTTVNELVDDYPVVAVLVVALVLIGLLTLVWRQHPLSRVVVCTCVIPVAAVCAVGVRTHVLLPRTLAPSAWGAMVLIGAAVDLALDRGWLFGAAVATLAAVVMVPSTLHEMRSHPPGQQAAFAWIEARARDGDVVAIHPSWMAPLVDWQFGARRPGPDRHVAVPGTDAIVLGRQPWSGRVWFVGSTYWPRAVPPLVFCGPQLHTPEYDVQLLSRTTAAC